MSAKLPRIKPVKVIRVLEKHDYICVRQSGSHMVFRNDEGIRVTVPYHSGKIIHPKILKRIIEDTGIPVEEFQ